jgi:hypothetical protein
MDLFEKVSFEERDRLCRGIDGIRDKYGFHSILKAGSFRDSGK